MLQQLLQSPTHPEMLGRLGRYDVESVIGCGGMGVVMKGFDRELHRPVAIKMVLPRLARHGVAKQRFMLEAKAAAAVLHPNVIAIHDISEVDGVPWFVMPLVVGPTLRQVVEQNGTPSHREIARIGLQIASGLAAAHAQGLVHHDIKPANILVDNQVNRIVITDFGLARRETEESMTQTGFLAGTINYMSPEQARGGGIDGRSDLFSLGSLLYFLASGKTPFRSDSAMGVIHQIGNEPHTNVRVENSDVPIELARAIDCLLEKHPDDRFESAAVAESWFREYLAFLNQPSAQASPRVPRRKRKRAPMWALGIVGASLLASCIWVWPVFRGDSDLAATKGASAALIGGLADSPNHESAALREVDGKGNLSTKEPPVHSWVEELEDEHSVPTHEFDVAIDPRGVSIPAEWIIGEDTFSRQLEELDWQIHMLQSKIEVGL